MSSHFDAFEMSPVPPPGPDAVAPEPFHGIYGMPSFVTIPTNDLAASVDFWCRGLGFFELFGIPGRLLHLRRWAFQDVLLVPTDQAPTTTEVPSMSLSFACVLDQLEPLVRACRELGTTSVSDPQDTPWNTRDVEVITPERVRVVFTAAKTLPAGSQEEQNLRTVGITRPGADDQDSRSAQHP